MIWYSACLFILLPQPVSPASHMLRDDGNGDDGNDDDGNDDDDDGNDDDDDHQHNHSFEKG